jgi:hypothetical protein
MTTTYRHRQVGRSVLIAAAALAAFGIGIGIALPAIPLVSLAFVVGCFALVIVLNLMICTLTTEVSASELHWWFGPGIWRKRIALSDIVRVTPVRLAWWYGAGIKYTGRAWVYLVSPGQGVELTLASGSVIRIGTDDPQGLIAALGKQT